MSIKPVIGLFPLAHARRRSRAVVVASAACVFAAAVGVMLQIAPALEAQRPPVAPPSLQADNVAARLQGVAREGATAMADMPLTGYLDRDFAALMKMHEEEGVRMAQLYLPAGRDPRMRELAQRLLNRQRADASDLGRWLRSRGQQ